ncbi:MAG TPA: DUF4034 domain-containing protein, partial [Verrucomicrobiae bacterium]
MMKKLIPIVLLFSLLGCSKKLETNQPPQPHRGEIVKVGKSPFPTVLVESMETKEGRSVSHQAENLFVVRNFDQIDALVAQLVASKDRYAAGFWKADFVFDGLHVPEDASDARWEAHLSEIRVWLQTKPDSIIPRVVLADNLIQYAWKARGSGWADSVNKTGWRMFSERVNEAWQVLAQAKESGKKCPQYWSL